MDVKQINRMLKAPEYRYLTQVGYTAHSMMNINWDLIPKRVMLINYNGTAIKLIGCHRFYDMRRGEFIDTPEAYYMRHKVPTDVQFTDAKGCRYFKKVMRMRKEEVQEYSPFFKHWSKIQLAPKLYPIAAERKNMQHVHKELISIWIENTNTKFEERWDDNESWVDKKNSDWDPSMQYRVKPNTIKREEFAATFLSEYIMMNSDERMAVKSYHQWLNEHKALKASMKL